MSRTHRTLCCALIALVAVLSLSGCSWKGDGKQVAAAIIATKEVKSRAFSGSLKMDMSQMQGPAGQAGGGPASVTMAFSGASDTSDPANPKMVMTMDAEGQRTSMVAPGDGKLYFTDRGKSYSIAMPPGQAQNQAINPQKIYAALGDAVGHFQKSAPITNAQGKAVDTISATVDKSKLCGEVLDAFGEAMSKSAGLGGSLGASGAAGAPGLGKDGKKMMQSFCKMMLKTDPRVWFGIDGGRLTDVELTADITVPFGGRMGLEVQYHEFNQGGRQTGFDAPAGATPVESLGALPAA